MTLVFDSEKKCAVCGKPSVQYDIVSTNSFGSPDLDTRPPEMERSTIDYWVQRCPDCGYCSSDIEKKVEGSEKIIKEGGYKDTLNDKDFPELANFFRCEAYIYERLENYSNSALAMIHAAWFCDDEKNKLGAKHCRLKGFELLQKLWSEGKTLFEHKASDYALAADLLRRSRKLMVADIIAEGLNSNPDDFTKNLLLAQKILFDKRDSSCYKMDDIDKIIEQNKESDIMPDGLPF